MMTTEQKALYCQDKYPYHRYQWMQGGTRYNNCVRCGAAKPEYRYEQHEGKPLRVRLG